MADEFVAGATVHLRFQHEAISEGLLMMAQLIAGWHKKRLTKAELKLAHDNLMHMAERTQFQEVDKLLEDFSSKLTLTDCDAAHHIVNDFHNKNEFSLVNVSVKEVKCALMYRRSCINDARNFLDYSLEESIIQ